MQESPKRPTHHDLARLPQRAIVAYAVRCARRLQPLFATTGIPDDNLHAQAVEEAIDIAERFCRGEAGRVADVCMAAKAAAKAASRVADAAGTPDAVNAARVAEFAAYAVATPVYAAIVAYATATVAAKTASAVDAAARADYDRLLSLNLGTYPELGHPIDPTATGPLGPLWPEGPPEWYPARIAMG